MDKFSIIGSLRTKIIFVVLVTSIISFSVVIFNHSRSLDSVLSNQTKLYTSGVYPFLNASISPLLFARDYASIQVISDSLVAAGTLEFIRIRDLSKKTVASSGSIPKDLLHTERNTASKNGVQLNTRGLMLSEKWIGHIDYAYSIGSIRGELHNVIVNDIFVATLAIISIMAILIVVVSFLTRPLKHLVDGARRITNGDLSEAIKVHGRDEIAATASEFNKMLVSLQHARFFQNETSNKLKRQKDLLAKTHKIARMGYWRLNLRENRISFSEECCEIFGLEKLVLDCDLDRFFENVHVDDICDVRLQLSIGISERSSELNYRIVMPDGEERVIYSKTELFCDKQNNPQTLLGIAQDITERYKVEKIQNDSEARLRAAQKIASIGNLEWRVSDGLGIWADEVYQVFGVTRESYPATFDSFIKLVHADDREFVLEKMKIDYEVDKLIEFEYRVSVGVDEIRWINAILKLELHSENSQARIVGIVQNISGRKTTEDRALLLQKQLQQSQKMEAIGQLTGGIAHDFNNILAVIMGYSGLALDRCIDKNSSQLKEYLQEIYHAGERATELISQMMTFSRTSINEPQTISIIPLVKDISKMLGSIMPSSIQIETHFEKNLFHILIDPIQLQQVIMNICINSRDAMRGQGHLDISIKSAVFSTYQSVPDPHTSGVFSQIISCESCHEVIADGDYIELSITDNGGGIEANDIAKIFEPFFTTKDVGKGTGMGLSMVHGIVHEHNGHILISSSVGVGTKFKIIFPSAISVNSELKKLQPDNDSSRPYLDSANILIVDDESSVACYIATLFGKYGSQVSVFTNSNEALQTYQDSPGRFNLLIIDQTMPELTGAEFSKIVLANNPEFPIILCTGYSDTINEDQAVKLGIRKYLTKPVKTEILLKVANELLREPLRDASSIKNSN